MSANYRYWCGECHYRTPWLTESQGAEQQIDHYVQRHPGVPPGGRVEVRQRADNGYGCLTLVGGLFLLLVLLSTCSSQSRGAPLPPTPTATTTAPHLAAAPHREQP